MSWERGPYPARPCPLYQGYRAEHLPPVYRLHGGCTRCPVGGPCGDEERRAREVEADEARRCVECGGIDRCDAEPEHRYVSREEFGRRHARRADGDQIQRALTTLAVVALWVMALSSQ